MRFESNLYCKCFQMPVVFRVMLSTTCLLHPQWGKGSRKEQDSKFFCAGDSCAKGAGIFSEVLLLIYKRVRTYAYRMFPYVYENSSIQQIFWAASDVCMTHLIPFCVMERDWSTEE